MRRRVAKQIVVGATVLVGVIFSGCARSPEEKSARFFEAGKKSLAAHDSARAVLQFRNAADLTPRDPEVQYQLALAYLEARNVRGAYSSLTRALELNPKHKGAQLKIGQLMAAANSPEWLQKAEERLQGLVEDYPDDPTALHALAITELKLGDQDDAVRHLELAVAAAPQDVLVASTLAAEKLRQKDAKGAEDVLKQAALSSPKSPDVAVLLGVLHAALGRAAEAEQDLKRALEFDPKHLAALVNLGTLQSRQGRKQEAEQNIKLASLLPADAAKPLYGAYLFQEGRRDEAIQEFERLVRENPEERGFRTRLVIAYRATGKLENANKVLNEALKKNPKDLDGLLQRAELSIATRKYGEAEGDLNTVVRLKPDSPEAHFAFARLHAARGASLMQRKELTEALRLNPAMLQARIELAKVLIANNGSKAALAILEETPESQKKLPAVSEHRVWAYLAAGQLTEARAEIDRTLAARRTPAALLQDSILKMREGQFVAARTSAKEGLAGAPEDLRLLRVLAGSYTAEKNLAGAIAEVRSHAAKNPKSAPTQYLLGALLFESGDRDQARQALTHAKAADPSYVPADLSLALISLLQANWGDARQTLTTMISDRGENPQARLYLGMLEDATGNRPVAIAHFRKVLEVQPDNAIALNNLAYLLTSEGNRTEEPLRLAQKAVELQPQNPEFEDTLGWVLYNRGIYPTAVKHLELAAAKKPTAVVRSHLAMAYFKAGQVNLGRVVLQQVLKMDPNLPEAKSAKEMYGIGTK